MRQYLVILLLALGVPMLTAQESFLGVSLPADVGYPFDITLFRPTDSTQLRSVDVLKKGQGPTVVAFWLTTCMPCHRELTAYTERFAEWKEKADFNLVAISTDFPQRFAQINPIVEEKQFPFEVYWDGHRAFRNVLPGELNGLPQVFLFDEDGRLVWHHRRYRPGDEAEMFAQVMSLQKPKSKE